MTCDFQQCGILTSVESGESVQPPCELKTSKWCSVSGLTVIEYSSDQQRFWSDCAYAQADLSLCWSHIPHCWKSHVVAHYSNDFVILLLVVISKLFHFFGYFFSSSAVFFFFLFFFSKLTFSKKYFKNTFRMPNGLDPILTNLCRPWSGVKLLAKVIS